MQMKKRVRVRVRGFLLQDLLGQNNPWASSDAPALGQPRLSSAQHVNYIVMLEVCSALSM